MMTVGRGYEPQCTTALAPISLCKPRGTSRSVQGRSEVIEEIPQILNHLGFMINAPAMVQCSTGFERDLGWSSGEGV